MYQTIFDLNNWWMYDREMVRAMIDRTEQVRGEAPPTRTEGAIEHCISPEELACMVRHATAPCAHVPTMHGCGCRALWLASADKGEG